MLEIDSDIFMQKNLLNQLISDKVVVKINVIFFEAHCSYSCNFVRRRKSLKVKRICV